MWLNYGGSLNVPYDVANEEKKSQEKAESVENRFRWADDIEGIQQEQNNCRQKNRPQRMVVESPRHITFKERKESPGDAAERTGNTEEIVQWAPVPAQSHHPSP